MVSSATEDVEIVREQLGDAGYQLLHGPDMREALQMIEATPPDLVLLDIEAPGMGAVQFCEALRAAPKTEAIPILIIGRPEKLDPEALLQIGPDGYVRRPFRQAELLSRIRTLLRLKELNIKLGDRNSQVLEANARLDQLNQELITRNRELEQGLEMAHRLQEALLPQHYPVVENMSFSHKYSPAEAVGGDLFQITGLADGNAVLFVTDVSGHGVGAALVASIVKAVIEHIDFQGKTPTDILKDFNSRFRSILGPMTPQVYATGVVIILDGPARSLRIANAGHPCPLVVSKERMNAEPVMPPDESGPALGFVRDPDYQTFQKQLSVGDILLAFTDGAYEVINPNGDMYGLARMKRLIADNTHLVPRDLIERIIRETDEFMGASRRPDDVCLIAVEVH